MSYDYEQLGQIRVDEEARLMKIVKEDEEKLGEVKKTIRELSSLPNYYDSFHKTIVVLMQSYPTVLDNYTKVFMNYKKYPDDNRYQAPFFTSVQEIKKMDESIESITKHVQGETDKINSLVDNINKTFNIQRKDK